MPAIQNLVVTDRAATPVAHTFKPAGFRDNGVVAVLEEAIGGTPVAARTYSISHRRASGKMKTRIVFNVPVVQTETINGIQKPKIVRAGVVDTTFTFSLDSTEEERNNVVGMYADSFGVTKTMVNDVVVKAEYAY